MRGMKQREMSRYSGLAGKYLLEQRKRTILTVVAVILSVALITSAGIFAQSIRELGVENVRSRFGGFYAQAGGFTGQDVARLRRHAVTETVGSTILVGSLPLTEELSAFVHAPDESWIETMNYSLTDGRFPNKSGEIAVEAWLFKAARMPVDLGNTVSVSLVLDKAGPEGAPPAEGVAKPRRVERTFTVVGLIAPDAAGISEGVAAALISQDEARSILGPRTTYRVGFTTTSRLEVQTAIDSVASSFDLARDEIYQNTALLTSMGSGRSSTANDALRTVEVIVAAILVVATVAVIYNSFTISVVERIRQFGIIRTVGATPRQIRRLVFRQAGVIAVVGATLGLGAGLLAVRVVVLVFNSFSMNIGFAGVAMSYPVSVLIGGPVLGILSVYISALLPARAAGRVSPLEAVLAEGRFVKDRIRAAGSPLLSRIFGVSGRIASQNLRRHPARFLVTVFSIGIGVALFVTFAGFFTILDAASSNIGSDVLRGDVTVVVRGDEHIPIPEDKRPVIEQLPGVESVMGIYEVPGYVAFPADLVEDAEDTVDPHTAAEVRDILGAEGPVGELSILGLGPEGLSRIESRILEGRRSYGALAEGGGVYIPDGFYEIGDVLSVVVGGRAVDLPVVGVADTLPGGNYNPGTAVAAIETVRAIAEDEGYTGLEVELVPGTDAQDVARSIEAIAGNRNDVFAFDMTTVEESGEQIGLQMSILLYGLVAVVSLIGAVNIINTITTNIILRVREFGTLRAVGMSARQMRGMVRIEAVLYGFWAVLGGGAIGVALTRMIFNNVTQVQAIAWQFPWVSVTVSTVAAVGLSLASAAIPMRRITDMSIVESIRTVA